MQANRGANPESIRLLRRFCGLGRLIGAGTKPGDLVVSPAAGGFVVLRAPMALGRVFIGCDIAHHREDQSAPEQTTRPIAKRLATGISATEKVIHLRTNKRRPLWPTKSHR